MLPISLSFAVGALAAPPGLVILNQPPIVVGDYATRVDDSGCGNDASIADNFVLTQSSGITQIVVWGSYISAGQNGAPPTATDAFAVIFHQDSAGLPGSVVSSISSLTASSRSLYTTAFGFSVYQYTLNLPSPLTLPAGTYWVEIYHHFDASQTGCYAWPSGTLDATNGVAGMVYAFATPGSSWITGSGDMAIQILASATAIPALGGSGLLALAALVALTAGLVLRRLG